MPQIQLLPDERPVGTRALIPIEDIQIPPSAEPPSEGLIESIRALGVLQPVVLIEPRSDSAHYEIADGRRRVLAAFACGLDFIPAVLYPSSTPRHVAAAMTITANTQRSASPISEYEAISTMIAQGASTRDIATQLRVPLRTVERRMRLAALSDDLLYALSEGLISLSAAEACVSLTRADQERVMAWIEEGRRVTPRMIREAFLREESGQTSIPISPTTGGSRVHDVDPAVAESGQSTEVLISRAGSRDWGEIVRVLEALSASVPDGSGYAPDLAVIVEDVQATLAELLDMIQPLLELP